MSTAERKVCEECGCAPAPTPTDRQVQVLGLVRHLTTANGWPPTIRELATALGVTSTNGVNEHLEALERCGLVERGVQSARALRLTTAGLKRLGVAS